MLILALLRVFRTKRHYFKPSRYLLKIIFKIAVCPFQRSLKSQICESLPLSPGVVNVVICKRTGCYNSVCYDVPRLSNQQAGWKKKKNKITDNFIFIAPARRCFAYDDSRAFGELGSSTADVYLPNFVGPYFNRLKNVKQNSNDIQPKSSKYYPSDLYLFTKCF